MSITKKLVLGLCVLAAVLLACRRFGLIRDDEFTYSTRSASRPAPESSSHDDYFSVITTEEVTKVTVTSAPWYVSTSAALALVGASGWYFWWSKRG